MRPLVIDSCGMVTGVGLCAQSTFAALRAGIRRIKETSFIFDGEWLHGSPVRLPRPVLGREKMLRMVLSAISQCLVAVREPPSQLGLALCVAEPGRPGRPLWLHEEFLDDVVRRLPATAVSEARLVEFGRNGPIITLGELSSGSAQRNAWIIAGVDSFLSAPMLTFYHNEGRILTAQNSDGFIPGEAASAILVRSAERAQGLLCRGVGLAHERASISSGEPLRADGLAAAIKTAVNTSGLSFADIDYRLTDLNGEQYRFKEASLALPRTMRVLKNRFDMWNPIESIGDVGAAIVPLLAGWALIAAQRGYSPGPGSLCHASDDDGARGALVLRFERGGRCHE